MKRSYTRESCKTCSARLIVVPFIQDAPNLAAKEIDSCFSKHEGSRRKRETFKGQLKDILQLAADGGKTVFVVGLGNKPNVNDWRNAMAKCFSIAAKKKFSSISVYLDEMTELAVSACIEAVTLGLYRFNQYKSSPRPLTVSQVKVGAVLKTVSHHAGSQMVKAACLRADAVNFCRDLVNEPTNYLGVTEMVAAARKVARAEGLRCRVISGDLLAQKGFRLIHAVGKGAVAPPALVELSYSPEKKTKRHIALVGKGVVFDSGGLCLKPAEFMVGMKTDMAGAAVVLSVMQALRGLSVQDKVTAYIPLAENAIGNASMRPGDVLQSYSGKTVEVTNTDAEGRLLLADALALAQKGRHDEIIDFATLTGACSIALGRKRGAVFSDNPSLLSGWVTAAENTGELIWPLPLANELQRELNSDVADLKNSGDRFGGSISAALFLREFTDPAKWVHFDIAGPARNTAANLICPKGGTGFMVLTVLNYLKNRS